MRTRMIYETDPWLEPFKPAIDARHARILADKAYLQSVYKEGAERAGYIARKTLRKVYKKVGFVER